MPLPKAAATFAGAIAIAVLLGWTLNVGVPKSPAAGYIAMQPWTATGMVLGAVALWLTAATAVSARALAILLTLALAATAGLPLFQDWTGYDFQTHLLMFPHAVLAAQPHPYPHPGRMAVITAVGFEALAAALLLASRAQRRLGCVAFSGFATAALVLMAFALLDYGAGLEPLAVAFRRSPVALYTALGIGALSIGTLALRPDWGWVRFALDHGRVGWIICTMLGGAVLLAAVGVDAAGWAKMIAQTGAQVALRLERLLSTIKDAETGERGYLLTGEERYLAPYETGRARLRNELTAVEKQLRDGLGTVPAGFESLQSMADDKMAVMADIVGRQRGGDTAGALALMKTDRGQVLMEAIRIEADALTDTAAAAVAEAGQRELRAAYTAGLGGLGLLIVALLASFTVVRTRQTAVLALAASEARFRDMSNAVPTMTWESDPFGMMTWLSESWQRYCGMNTTDLLGSGWLATLHPDERLEGQTKWREAMRTGLGYVRRRRLRRASDGAWRWHLARAEPIRAADGSIGRWVGSVTDVHDVVEAENALRERKALLRVFVERTPAAIAMFDGDMRYLAVSDRFLTDLGFDVATAAVIGHSHYDLFPECPERWRDIHRRVLAGETLSAEDDPFERMDGHVDWVRWEMTPWRLVDGVVGGALLFAEVVTARKQAEAALAESEARLRLVQQVGGIAYSDRISGAPALVCAEYARIYGLPAGQSRVLVDEWLSRVHPDDRDRLQAETSSLVATGGTRTFTFRIGGCDEPARWIEMKMEVFGAQAGTFERIITAQRDVTETICAREALASAEAEVAAVLRDTVERQEAERRRLARELHDCLGQHVAVIHMGLDEIIRQSNDDPSVLEQTRHLKATATEVSHEISRLAWELRPVGLDELGLETAIRSFTETISVRCGLPIDVFIAPDQRRLPPAVEATLYRVMQEAITNIVKHANASRSGIMLEIANGEASMVIEDDGCGFVWDDMRVARPGDRLGLLGMRERLSLVGGVLEIESAPGNGAALIIHVPLQCTEVQT